MNADRLLIDHILAPGTFTIVFQPILEVRGGVERLHGVECLTRGLPGTALESPVVLFEYARRRGLEARADRTCVNAAIEACARLPSDVRVSVNVHASTLGRDAGFPEFLAGRSRACGIDPSRVTVEVVEHAPPIDDVAFAIALGKLRAKGMRIALDDVGLGHSNFKMMIDCRPDYFKIDGYFVRGAAGDAYRRDLLDAVARLARSAKARVVAEGVEELVDYEAVKRVGIDLVQGYLFSRPLSGEELRNYPLLPPSTSGTVAIAR